MISAPQHTEIGRLFRKLTRQSWRVLWRALRITARESAKVTEDMMIFGTGYLQHGDFGDWRRDGSDVVQRVPPETIWLRAR